VVEALIVCPDFLAVSHVDRDGFTALHAAAYCGHARCAQLLLVSPRFSTAVGVVGVFDCLRPVGHWATKAAAQYDMNTALHMAAAAGHAEICGEILDRAPLDCSAADHKNRMGSTALHMAARGGHVATVRSILRSGGFSAVNAVDARGYTALHWAAQHGDSQMCEEILQREEFTEISGKDLKGRTSMDIAKEFGNLQNQRVILARLGVSGLCQV